MNLTVSLGTDSVGLRTAFDPFFHAHFERVARAAAFVTRDAAAGQDLAQEAFTRLLERWDDMASDDHARNFVYRVAINLARSHLRKHSRVFLYGLARPEASTGPTSTDASDDWFGMIDALRALSPRQRACVVLVDYADMDAAAAADILGMSAATVRVHLMRGRRALRDGLAEKEDVS